jgi:predicted AlkP superfamily pyrophosphatase or phosphodiesterase
MLCSASRKAKCRRGIFVVSHLLAVLAALGFWALRLSGQTLGTGEARARHVLVISVDGLGANLYAQLAPTVRVPNLQRLRAEGSYAEGVTGVYPSVTYASHTTIVTGRMPAEHGIYTNLSSRQAGQSPRDWFWFSKAIQAPTLWDEARRNHLTTGSVFWPVTAGALIDWDIPEIWDPQKGEVGDPLYVAKYATPGLLFQALTEIGPPPPGTDQDVSGTRLATFLLKAYKPNLLLVHFLSLDTAEHRHGPQSSEVAATLANEDKLIGDLLEALKENGLEKSTDVFVVSDHGFLTVLNELAPNVLLAQAGLLTTDEKGSITGGKVATVSNGGSFFIYWPEGQDLRAEVDAALKPLRDQGVLWGIFNRSALREMGAEPAAQMALEAAEGWAFSSGAHGALVSKMKAPSGTHGYLPSRSGLEASFVAWGPEIRAGVNLHRVRMTAIGPTILKAMGIQDPQFGDEPALAEIFR